MKFGLGLSHARPEIDIKGGYEKVRLPPQDASLPFSIDTVLSLL
jgi:hypothetical protein